MSPKIAPSEITPYSQYVSRREVLAGALGLGVAPGLAVYPSISLAQTGAQLAFAKNSKYSVDQTPNSWEDITTYNNYYEFGIDKGEPAKQAQSLRTSPWSVSVGGEAETTGTFTLEDILKPHALEERIYPLRCVEGWSMVIPWVGFPLGDLLKRFKPTQKAKYVAFKTLFDPKQMPGEDTHVLPWPYAEGLRIDEAMHPLTLIAVGVYGRVLPNQNGAPLRLVVPWKYGFKSIKAIAGIQFTEQQPVTAWSKAVPGEYGFYANVNPAVDHPRWSQATERRIGAGPLASMPFGARLSGSRLLGSRRPTLPFNGFASEVAGLYSGMDLKRNF